MYTYFHQDDEQLVPQRGQHIQQHHQIREVDETIEAMIEKAKPEVLKRILLEHSRDQRAFSLTHVEGKTLMIHYARF